LAIILPPAWQPFIGTSVQMAVTLYVSDLYEVFLLDLRAKQSVGHYQRRVAFFIADGTARRCDVQLYVHIANSHLSCMYVTKKEYGLGRLCSLKTMI
jgi:hypothetical protein